MHALEALKKLVIQKETAEQSPPARDTRIRAWEVKPKADFKSPADLEYDPIASGRFDEIGRAHV